MKIIVARYMNGNKVVGYYLKDENQQIGYLDREVVEMMALHKQIANCRAQESNGKVLLKGVGIKLKELPKVEVKEQTEKIKEQLRLEGRIIKDKEVIGYRVRNLRTNELRNISKAIVMKLVREKKVINARVQRYKENDILRGVGCDLSQLEKINYKTKMA